MQKPPVYLLSLGCAKNLVDSEVMLGYLIKAKFPIVRVPNKAEIIIINTCSFIREAKEESLETIVNLSSYKKTGACNLLIVTGCLPQRYGDALSKLIPEVDVFIGTDEFYRIVEIIEDHLNKRSSPRFYLKKTLFLYDESTPRLNTSLPGNAYVKIAEGCSHQCSFCIIPLIRGPFRSRNPDSVVKEVSNLSALGIKEINLVAQDTTRYGKDLSPSTDLATLLRRLASLKGIEWIRLLYAHPLNITDEVIDVIREENKICKYLDLPFQHVNSEILKAMNRKYDRMFIYQLIDKIRAKIPGTTLRTTLMVGFPGETENQFNELLDFVQEVKFDRLGVFTYSNEEGTSSFRLPDQIPEKIKEKRRQIIMSAQAEISREKNQKLVGKVEKVLIEKKEKTKWSGRTAAQAPEVDGITYVSSDYDLKIGEFYNVLITQAGVYDLKGVA